MVRVLACLAMLGASSAASAQYLDNSPPPERFDEEQIAAIGYPELAFEETTRIVKNYDKYFYFHRPDTGFEEAFADIRECDALASGNEYFASQRQEDLAAATLGGLIGGGLAGALGPAIGDAIFGSAARRKDRRANLRTCMGYKGYQRYGLDKGLWREFNFEEGNRTVPASERREYLLVQAKVAAGPTPGTEPLEP